MCVAKTARRRRKQMRLDPRYGGWRKSAQARDHKLAALKEKQRLMALRKGANATKRK